MEKIDLTQEEIEDIRKRWMACPVRQWNTSCGNEKTCMDPCNPKCPKNSGKTEVIFPEADEESGIKI